jgi:hypothetical protein
MRRGTLAILGGLAVGLSVALAGCLPLGGSLLPGRELASTRPPRAPEPLAPELRIADTQASARGARGSDVPLVPVPPPPLGRPADDGEVRPVAHSTPAPRQTLPAGAGSTPRQLHRAAAARYAAMDSYIVRLTRREFVKGRLHPEEVLLFKFRKEPWSVYFKWLGKEGTGREVLYVRGRHDNKIHSLLAAGDIPFVPAGKRMALDPDSLLVRSASRHPIHQAGIGASIDRLGALLDALDRGDRRQGTLTPLGSIRRPEFTGPVAALEHVLPPGFDPSLPRGGRRMYVFNPNNSLPTLIVTRDESNQEVEYYRYDRLQCPVKLDDEDFDPDRLWGKPASAQRK